MRGTLLREVNLLAVLGIIPAYAGNTLPGREPVPHHGDHPRVCGEHPWELAAASCSLGSSPRMRGTQNERDRVEAMPGIIPAYAGNTILVVKDGKAVLYKK